MAPQGKGTAVKVKMRMHLSVIAFMAFWLAVVLAAGVSWTYSAAIGATSEVWVAPLPFVMILFAWALASGGFWFEARKQRAKLVEIFEAQTT